MALPTAKRDGDGMLELKIVAGADLVPGQVMTALPGWAGIVMGLQDIPSGDPAVLALDGVWTISCATGTTASAGDPAYFNTSTGLIVSALAAGTIEVGTFFKAKTSGQLTASIALNQSSRISAAFIAPAAQNAMTTAGAVSVLNYYTTVNTTTGSGHASTLANGLVVGQLKKIQLIVDAGDLVLTPASLSGGTTITFADAGDYAVLQWNGTAWLAIETGNDADGATGPVIA